MAPEKPKPVLYAELALWVWTVWTCGYGVYQASIDVVKAQIELTEKLQGLATVDTGFLMNISIAAYVLLSVVSAWIILAIGKGRHWARSSLLWGFGFQALMDLMPPWHPAMEYLKIIPDWGLQTFAIVMLYTWPGRIWYHKEIKKAGG